MLQMLVPLILAAQVVGRRLARLLAAAVPLVVGVPLLDIVVVLVRPSPTPVLSK